MFNEIDATCTCCGGIYYRFDDDCNKFYFDLDTNVERNSCILSLIYLTKTYNFLKKNKHNNNDNDLLHKLLSQYINISINNDINISINCSCGMSTLTVYYMLTINNINKFDNLKDFFDDLRHHQINYCKTAIENTPFINILNNCKQNKAYIITRHDFDHALTIVKHENKIYFIQTWFNIKGKYEKIINYNYSDISFYIYDHEINNLYYDIIYSMFILDDIKINKNDLKCVNIDVNWKEYDIIYPEYLLNILPKLKHF